MPEAKATLAEAMKLNPKLSVAWFHERIPSLIDLPPGFREALIKAGLPEERAPPARGPRHEFRRSAVAQGSPSLNGGALSAGTPCSAIANIMATLT